MNKSKKIFRQYSQYLRTIRNKRYNVGFVGDEYFKDAKKLCINAIINYHSYELGSLTLLEEYNLRFAKKTKVKLK